MNRKSLIIVGVLAVVIVVATGAVIRGQGSGELRACADCPPPRAPGELPPVGKGPMTERGYGICLLELLFDDGTCESGLGAGATMAVTDFVEFDVPTQCIFSGLDIVGLTTRLNTGQPINYFAFGQAGATPPPAGLASTVPLGTAIPASGPCPSKVLTSRTVGPGAAIITGTSNFFAGVQASGFVGRDSNGPPAGRMWLNCSFCGMTQYSPTTLSGLGLGGNWMIRVIVECNCVPVELMGFDVS